MGFESLVRKIFLERLRNGGLKKTFPKIRNQTDVDMVRSSTITNVKSMN
jgi:hypothetical protein